MQEYLARTGRRIPIIFVTAHANESDEHRALLGAATAFLRKPFSEQALLNAIKAALGENLWEPIQKSYPALTKASSCVTRSFTR